MMIKKKGQVSVGQLAGLAITFVVVTVVVAFGATILNDVQVTQCTGFYNTATGNCQVSAANTNLSEGIAFNTTGQGLTSLEKFGTNLPTLAIVIVAAVIIGVLASAFVLRG